MRHLMLAALGGFAVLFLAACQGGDSGSPQADPASPVNGADQPDQQISTQSPESAMSQDTPLDPSPSTEVATLGAGCYWCVEAVLEQVEGVQEVVSGFMGGQSDQVTYEEVCTGRTGHAEVVQVRFDPSKIGYAELLDWFWRLHDPTTLNRQGADRGTQYRSAIFYHSAEQQRVAEKSKREAGASFRDAIVTEITPASKLITAPSKHQDYYRQNRQQGYCQMVIAPKLRKLGLAE